jgi:hypothetical protein
MRSDHERGYDPVIEGEARRVTDDAAPETAYGFGKAIPSQTRWTFA